MPSLFERTDEATDVGCSIFGVEAGDEDGGAEDLGESGGVVMQRLTGRWAVRSVKLERSGPLDSVQERLALQRVVYRELTRLWEGLTGR